MKFAIVVLSYDQPETTVECLKSILSLRPRDFPEKNVFVIHNGSNPTVIQDLQNRFNRFHHVVLQDNVGFAAGANAGIRVALQMSPWVLFVTQDCNLVHFPKSPPFEPCLAATRIYKRKQAVLGSVGGAVDLELGQAYFCQQGKDFWRSFEDSNLHPFVPRTAFWIHQQVFEKARGFDESLYSQWEDVELSLRLRKLGELLQLDETTEFIHTRKGLCRQDPFYRSYLNTRNRLTVCRQYLPDRWSRVRFELGALTDFFQMVFQNIAKRRFQDLVQVLTAVRDSTAVLFKRKPRDEAEVGAPPEKTKTRTKTRTQTKTKTEKKKEKPKPVEDFDIPGEEPTAKPPQTRTFTETEPTSIFTPTDDEG